MTEIKFRNDVSVELIKSNAIDEDVAHAAWVSNYGGDARTKDTEKMQGLIKYLYREKHMSPFEHGSFTFFIEAPIFVAREFMRHRTMAFNEWSGRYAELEPVFYVPSDSRPLKQVGKIGNYTFEEGTDDQMDLVHQQTSRSYELAWKSYENMLSCGVAKEVARNVLPVGIYTKFYATVNPRNLMHFLGLRTAPNALLEIRMVADEMEKLFAQQMPITYSAWDKES